MSTDIKISKSQTFKIIQSGGSFGSQLGNLGKKCPINVAIPSAKDNLPSNNFKCSKQVWKKNRWMGVVRAGKRFTLFILEWRY